MVVSRPLRRWRLAGLIRGSAAAGDRLFAPTRASRTLRRHDRRFARLGSNVYLRPFSAQSDIFRAQKVCSKVGGAEMNVSRVTFFALCAFTLTASSTSAAVKFSRDNLRAALKAPVQTAKDCNSEQVFGRDNRCHAKAVKPICPTSYNLAGDVCLYSD